MSEGSSPVLKLLVEKYLKAGLIDTALFYAERLFYENGSPDNLFTFATCYFRKGKLNQAYLLLQPKDHWSSSSENSYLFALCCVELDKLNEARQALQSDNNYVDDMVPSLESVSETPGEAAGVFLLGKICRLQHCKDNAIQYYKLSLQMDPYLWCSITELSDLGVDVNIEQMFHLQNTEMHTHGAENNSHLFGDSAVKSPPADKSIFITGKNLFADQTMNQNNDTENDHSAFNLNNESQYQYNNTSNANMSQYMNQHGDVSNLNHSYSRKMYDLNLTESLLNNSLPHGAANNMHGHSLTPPNHTSMALGLSSMALRIPFGSPQSMTSPLIESAQQQSYMYSHQKQRRNQQHDDSMDSAHHNPSQALFGSSMNMSTAGKSNGNRSYAHLQTDMMLTAEKSSDNLSRINGNLFGNSEDMSRHNPNNNHNMHTDSSSSFSGVRGGGASGISSNLFGLPTPGLTPIPFPGGGNNSNNLFHTNPNHHLSINNTSHISHFNDSNSELLDTSRKVDFDISHTDSGDAFDAVKTQVKQRRNNSSNSSNSNSNTVALNKSLDFGDEEEVEEDQLNSHNHQQTAVRINSHQLSSNNAPLSAAAFAASSSTTNSEDHTLSTGATTRRVSFATARLSFSGATNQPYTGLRSGAQRVPLKDREVLSEEEEDEVNEEESHSHLQHTPFTPSVNNTQYSLVDTPNSLINTTNSHNSHRRILEGESPFKLQRKTSSPMPLHHDIGTTSEEVSRHHHHVEVEVEEEDSCEISPIRGSVDTTPASYNNTMNYTLNKTINRTRFNNTNLNDISAIDNSSGDILQNNTHLSPIFDSEQMNEKAKILEKTPHKKRSMLPVRKTTLHTTSATPSSVPNTSFLSHLQGSNSGGEEDSLHNTQLNHSQFNDISNISHNNIHMDQSLLLSPSQTVRKGAQVSHTSPVHTTKHNTQIMHTKTVVKNRNTIVSPERHRVSTTNSNPSSPVRDTTKKHVHIVSTIKSKQTKHNAHKHPTTAALLKQQKEEDHHSHVDKTQTTTTTVTSKSAPKISPEQYESTHKLIAVYAKAHQHLSHYESRQCVELLASLPKRHFKGGLTQQMLGRANYEMNKYKECVAFYREMLKVEPFRLVGMEILSTALWHLRLEKDLCALASQVSSIDRLSPETWCVVGNCFSFQKEPETAIKFFDRALQLDKSFVYAHTLSGHEQVNNEDLEKAILYFRSALLFNDRHYNAWYGLGSIYYRQERFELAEYHFKRALSLNAESSVLHCYLGMALHAQNTRHRTRPQEPPAALPESACACCRGQLGRCTRGAADCA